MDDTEGLVRLIIESFRDASNPSVDIAVEEIMRTLDDAISEARAEGAQDILKVIDTAREAFNV